jgi:hypothetical protein
MTTKKQFISHSLHARIIHYSQWLVCLYLALQLASCASSPRINGAEEQRFPSIEAIVPEWQPLAQTETSLPDSGIAYFAGTTQQPRLRFKAVRVNLGDPSLRIVVNAETLGAGVIPSVKVSSFAAQYDCLVGINTAPFRPVSAREGEARTVVGLSIADGKVISPPQSPYDALVFYADDKAAIIKQSQYVADTASSLPIENAVGGFFTVLLGGSITENARQGQARHPRSAAGLSPDGSTLYLLVVDGRQFGSIGATEAELAAILSKLGAFDGLNFDGGGSTALALRVPGGNNAQKGRVRVVNIPIHNHIPGWERAVATCLGISILSGDD